MYFDCEQHMQILATKEDKNPFILEHGKVYLKADSIRFENNGSNNVKAVYLHKGKDVFHVDIEGGQISNDSAFILSDIECKIKVNFVTD